LPPARPSQDTVQVLKDPCAALGRTLPAFPVGTETPEGSLGFFVRDAAGACPPSWLNP
jgi:hypothetical protein